MTTSNGPDGWYGRRRGGSSPEPSSGPGGLSRRTRAVLIAAEATVGAVVGGAAVGGALGWTVIGLALALAAVVLLARRGALLPSDRRAPDPAALVGKLRVAGVPSRSSGDVGVIGDGQGFAAGLELDISKGALLDVATLCSVAATDPSRPSALQVRLTNYAPPAPGAGVLGRPRGAAIAVHRRLHVLLRLEPAWARDVVARHGGGAQGSRAALVAAVDRLAARLRRAGIPNRVLDPGALNALLAEDTAADLPTRLFSADLTSRDDLDQLLAVLQHTGPERSIVSVCVDLASSGQWESSATVQVGARDPVQADAIARALHSDGAVVGPAPTGAVQAVLPLGGGPGDLVSVLTLARG